MPGARIMDRRQAIGYSLSVQDYGFFAAIRPRAGRRKPPSRNQVMWKMKSLALRFAAITLFSSSDSFSVTGAPSGCVTC